MLSLCVKTKVEQNLLATSYSVFKVSLSNNMVHSKDLGPLLESSLKPVLHILSYVCMMLHKALPIVNAFQGVHAVMSPESG